MKFYYVALTINKEHPFRTQISKRFAIYTKKHEAIETCILLNYQCGSFIKNEENKDPFKVYCVESEPMEVTSD